MVFADSKILLLLWVLPICMFFMFVEMRTIRRRFESFTRYRLDDLLNGVWSYKRAVFKSILLCLSLLALIFALARPRWGFEWKEMRRGGNDIVIALDLSTSMLATDITPNRLERAKREIIDLLKILKGDRIGIVAFAGVSFVYTPLTVDYRLADMFIQQMSLKMMPVQGTVIGEALNQSIDALEKASSSESQGKAIILITDGEDQGSDLLATAKKAKEKGIRVYAIGIGSEAGAPIPLPDGGFKKDHEGNIVVSKLDQHTLQNITSETGGLYVHSTTGNLDLETIYKDIRKIDKDDETDLTKQKIWHERFQIFIAIALALLLLEFFMRSTRRKRSKDLFKSLAILCLLFPIYENRAQANNLSEGQKAFENQDYKTAADKFLKAEIEHPDEPIHAYNRGVSQFYNKQYKEAAEAFTKSAQSPDPLLAEKSFYNLGNSQVYAGNLQEAIKAYEEALKRNPQDKEAQENLAWTKKKLEEQEKKKDQDKDQDKKDDNKDEKDQNKKDENKKEDKQEQNKDKQDQNKDKQEQDKKDQDQKKEDKQSQSENKDKQEQDKKDSGSEQKPEDKKQEQKASEEKNGSESKVLTKEQAEKLLRMIEDQEQVYGMPPKYNKPPSPPNKDW